MMKLYDNDAYRDEFMDGVYSLLADDPTWDRANSIIDLFDSVPEVEAIPVKENETLKLDELEDTMERLTVKCDDGHWGLSFTVYDRAVPSRILEKLPIAIDRLAAYEDTGLTPEGIIELKGSWRAACKFYGINPASSISNAPLTLDELREMVDEAVYIVELHVEGEKAMIVDETAYEIVHEYGPSRLVVSSQVKRAKFGQEVYQCRVEVSPGSIPAEKVS